MYIIIDYKYFFLLNESKEKQNSKVNRVTEKGKASNKMDAHATAPLAIWVKGYRLCFRCHRKCQIMTIICSEQHRWVPQIMHRWSRKWNVTTIRSSTNSIQSLVEPGSHFPCIK